MTPLKIGILGLQHARQLPARHVEPVRIERRQACAEREALPSNAAEASLVRDVARTGSSQIVKGFHYLHQPVNQRLRELVTAGDLGDIQQVDIELSIPSPPDSDPRWSLQLAGRALS